MHGGAIANVAVLTMENCTLSNNQADYGGGIWNNTERAGETLNIVNCTLSKNGAQPNQGGGIYLNWAEGGNGEHLTNTIIADNRGDDCRISHGTLETNVNNLIQDGTCSPALSGDPLLGDLTDNGGPTLTHALLSGSPAINAGSNAHVPAGMTTDQRGEGYPRIQNGTVDIGAFEYYQPLTLFPIRTPDGKTVIIMF